jgi:hypothetical protein
MNNSDHIREVPERVFFVKCRPQGADIIDLVLAEKRVFIGYPPWRRGVPYNPDKTGSTWRRYLAAGEMESKLAAIRQCTHTGRPLGSTEFVQALEGSMKRRLAPQKGGRPPKACLDARQSELAFEPE